MIVLALVVGMTALVSVTLGPIFDSSESWLSVDAVQAHDDDDDGDEDSEVDDGDVEVDACGVIIAGLNVIDEALVDSPERLEPFLLGAANWLLWWRRCTGCDATAG